jgi:hypothetical protein
MRFKNFATPPPHCFRLQNVIDDIFWCWILLRTYFRNYLLTVQTNWISCRFVLENQILRWFADRHLIFFPRIKQSLHLETTIRYGP